MGSSDPIVDCGDKAGEELIACLAPNRRTEVRFFYPRAYMSGVLAVREQLSTAAGEYVSIFTPVQSTTLGTKAIKVFMEGCRADIDTYCAQVTPGEQRLLSCIYAYNDKVSDECKGSVRDALLLVKADIAQANFVGRLCGSDILAHCGDVGSLATGASRPAWPGRAPTSPRPAVRPSPTCLAERAEAG
jgi:hypothetical protein